MIILIINLEQEDIYEFARLSFITKCYRVSYLNTFNNYYLQKYIKEYINVSNFKFNLFQKLGITKYYGYEIDVANSRIIFKEDNDND